MTVRMDIESIIHFDVLSHYTDALPETGLKSFYYYMENGYWALKYDKTLFVTKKNGDVIEYHTYNAGSLPEYIDASYKFARNLKGAKKAITTVTNPKLAAIVKRYFSKTTIIHDGFAITDLGKARNGCA